MPSRRKAPAPSTSPDQPAEVLAEEPGDERQRQEDRGDHRQPLHDLVLAVGRRVVERLAQRLDLDADAGQPLRRVAQRPRRGVVAGRRSVLAAEPGQDVALRQHGLPDVAEPPPQRRRVAGPPLLHLRDLLVEAAHRVHDAGHEPLRERREPRRRRRRGARHRVQAVQGMGVDRERASRARRGTGPRRARRRTPPTRATNANPSSSNTAGRACAAPRRGGGRAGRRARRARASRPGSAPRRRSSGSRARRRRRR